jgi:hypothetical protein
MGTFRIEIQAVGGHGCQREIKDGGHVQGCGLSGCPDCIARRAVEALQTAGVFFDLKNNLDNPDVANYARVTHWPGQPSAVVDDLLTGIRKGSF